MKRLLLLCAFLPCAFYAADTDLVKVNKQEKAQKKLVYQFLDAYVDLSSCSSGNEAREVLQVYQRPLENIFDLFQKSGNTFEVAYVCGAAMAKLIYQAFPNTSKQQWAKDLDWLVQTVKSDGKTTESVFEIVYLKEIYTKKQIPFIDQDAFNAFYVRYGNHALEKIKIKCALREMQNKKQICQAAAKGYKAEMIRFIAAKESEESSDDDSSYSGSDSEVPAYLS